MITDGHFHSPRPIPILLPRKPWLSDHRRQSSMSRNEGASAVSRPATPSAIGSEEWGSGLEKSQPKEGSMQTPSLGATALALVAVVNLSPARAEGPKLSGGTLWSGISQPVDHDA